MKNTLLRICMISSLLFLSCHAMAADEKLDKAIAKSAQSLSYTDGKFSGPALETLIKQSKESQFFLIGEEHGIAENPKLAGQLFQTLSGAHYRHLVIEVSPQIATIMEQRLTGKGLQGLRELFAEPGGEPAFFGMDEEAEMLATVKSSLPDQKNVLLGVDYEVASDRQLLNLLNNKNVPPPVIKPLFDLNAASATSWHQYYEQRSPQFIFSFAGDPSLVTDVRNNWPGADAETRWILDELEQTLAINRLWVSGKGWESNVARANLLRNNFIRHWRDIEKQTPDVGMMVKLGATHSIRGLNTNNTYDLGTLIPEIAQIRGTSTVSLLVLPGAASQVAVLDPVNWKFNPAPAKDGYTKGLQPLYKAAGKGMTMFDSQQLRPLLRGKRAKEYPALARSVFGFDYIVIMTGSTPAGEFEHD